MLLPRTEDREAPGVNVIDVLLQAGRFVANIPFQIAAFLWRRMLRQTTWIAVIGSNGKTTAKQLLTAALATRYPTAMSPGNANARYGLPRAILGVRPRHRFAVVEVGIKKTGQMWRSGFLLRPDIVVVVSVSDEHAADGLRDLPTAAAEKSRLLDFIRPGGFAVLNADDPHVAAMSGGRRIPALRFGADEAADLRLLAAGAAWPQGLRLRVRYRGEESDVATRLVGEHWRPSVLGALLTAGACGVPMDEACAAAGTAEVPRARLEPVMLPSGAVLLRDDYNGSLITLGAALAVLAGAAGSRRIAVIGRIRGDERTPAERMRDVGSSVASAADLAVFVDECAPQAAAAAVEAGMAPDRVSAFPAFSEAVVDHLRRKLQRGDLVLIKSGNPSHLARIPYALQGPIACWKTRCRRTILCDECPELRGSPLTARPGPCRP